jgi:small neutral amino acid transporter SnatA (MarC family)
MDVGEDRSEEERERAIWSLPTVMPLPRGPSSSKALLKASPKMWREVDVLSVLACLRGCIGEKEAVGVVNTRSVVSVCIVDFFAIVGVWVCERC